MSSSSVRREPEVHVIGQLVGASEFDSDNAFCQFDVKVGPSWTLLGGEVEGQTQVDYQEQVRAARAMHLCGCVQM
jgi:hypothetical protein